MYLHRGFFARAVFEGATDPLQSKFAHSVLSVFNSSRDLLKGFREVLDEHPRLLPRLFGWWGHAFSSLVSLGGLVTMAPHCNLARESLIIVSIPSYPFSRCLLCFQFDEACETLKRGVTGPQAGRVLVSSKYFSVVLSNNYLSQHSINLASAHIRPSLNSKQETGSPFQIRAPRLPICPASEHQRCQ